MVSFQVMGVGFGFLVFFPFSSSLPPSCSIWVGVDRLGNPEHRKFGFPVGGPRSGRGVKSQVMELLLCVVLLTYKFSNLNSSKSQYRSNSSDTRSFDNVCSVGRMAAECPDLHSDEQKCSCSKGGSMQSLNRDHFQSLETSL